MIVLPQMRFTPTQKIMTEPVKDKLAIAASVITGAITRERSVTLPCKIATGIAEKMQPTKKGSVSEEPVLNRADDCHRADADRERGVDEAGEKAGIGFVVRLFTEPRAEALKCTFDI